MGRAGEFGGALQAQLHALAGLVHPRQSGAVRHWSGQNRDLIADLEPALTRLSPSASTRAVSGKPCLGRRRVEFSAQRSSALPPTPTVRHSCAPAAATFQPRTLGLKCVLQSLQRVYRLAWVCSPRLSGLDRKGASPAGADPRVTFTPVNIGAACKSAFKQERFEGLPRHIDTGAPSGACPPLISSAGVCGRQRSAHSLMLPAKPSQPRSANLAWPVRMGATGVSGPIGSDKGVVSLVALNVLNEMFRKYELNQTFVEGRLPQI